jgi:hypothetical protein
VSQIRRAVSTWWPDSEAEIARANSRPDLRTRKPTRTDSQMIEEILTRVRDISKDVVSLRQAGRTVTDTDTLINPAVAVRTAAEFMRQIERLPAEKGHRLDFILTGEGDHVIVDFKADIPDDLTEAGLSLGEELNIPLGVRIYNTSRPHGSAPNA